MKKQEFKKMRRGLRNFQDNFKHSNIQIIGVPEGEEEQQEVENLFEKIMKVNFPNLAKEIKKNPQETNSEGKEAEIQIIDLEHKEEIDIRPEQNEETRIQKNKENLRRPWDISKRADIQIVEVPEGEEEEQEIENLL